MKRRKTAPPPAEEQERLAVCDELARLVREKLAAPDPGADPKPAQAVALYREAHDTGFDTLRRRLDDIEGAANVLQWLGRRVEGGVGVEPAAVRWVGEQLHDLLADAHALLDQVDGGDAARPKPWPSGRAETIVVDPHSMA